ncbi:hypothetical protein [Stratiformator vulcanicus]|nr:hypothetical protein [Stratiformator vulcanicus]
MNDLATSDCIHTLIVKNCRFPEKGGLSLFGKMPGLKFFDFKGHLSTSALQSISAFQDIELLYFELHVGSFAGKPTKADFEAVGVLNSKLRSLSFVFGSQIDPDLLADFFKSERLKHFYFGEGAPELSIEQYERLLLMDQLESFELDGWDQLSGKQDLEYVRQIIEVVKNRARRRKASDRAKEELRTP